MKISEIIDRDGLKKFKARVRIGGTSVSIGIRAASLLDARLALNKCYNVISVVEVRDINEQQLEQFSPSPIPDQLKHQLIQKILAQEIMRLNNTVKVDRDDVQVAVQSVEREQKKADFEHKLEVEQEQRRQLRLKRRR
jgi:hypothetical protein